LRHEGRVAVVTGGSSGIGQAIALRLAAEGATVASLDIANGAQTEARAATQAGPGSVRSYACELAEPDQISAAVARIHSELGEPSILVHAAAWLFLQPVEALSLTAWRRTQAINVDAAFLLVQALLPSMRLAGWGRVVLITSSTFWVGGSRMTHYVTSKGGLIGLAHGLAPELGAYGITVNCVAPGLTRTAKVEADMTEEFFAQIAQTQSIKRNGRPEDHAAAVAFLASDDAAFITGQTLLVDGGQALT
jgi:NAD(P)-dependent dehydrogenase (short-subunit alcohol dehydrogenase family)